MKDLKIRLAERREIIDRELDRWLRPTGSHASTVEQAMHYAVMGGGKRLRPILVLESCLACGGDDLAALAPATAVEMIHTYSLVHDDLPAMDNDDLRRGRATTHKEFGEAMAILAGDGLLTLAFRILADKPSGDALAAARCRAVALMAERAGVTGMVGGQVADLEAEGQPLRQDRLEWIHRHKTGALLRASVELGAILAGSGDAVIQALRRFGDALGLAFQISDDILDRTATAADLGKTPGKDQEAGKTTYPALLGLDGARSEAERQTEMAAAALEDVPGDTSVLAGIARYIEHENILMARPRLDQILVERGLAPSRTRAQALIMAGRVHSDGVRLDKPGVRMEPGVALTVDPGERYVSRGGLKLHGALEMFEGSVAGTVALDVGASTGGFTQVLLEAGAQQVIALDVGRGQLDWSLRTDPRVTVIEGFNARHMNPADLPHQPDVAVIDVSFISLTLILPAVFRCLTAGGQVVALVKPQFEAGRGKVGKGGIVRDGAVHREVLERIVTFATENHWGIRSIAVSSIRGAEGNVEFFIGLTADPEGLDRTELDRMVGRLTSDPGGASG